MWFICLIYGSILQKYLKIKQVALVRLSPHWLSGKESALQCRRCGRSHRFDPWVGKIPRRRKWQPTPVLLPGKFLKQRNLAAWWAAVHGVAMES